VDVLDDITQLNLAVDLLRLKARISIVYRETGVSRPKLRILHRELHGEGASSGQIPAIGGATIQTRLQQVHAGLFAALFERYAGSELTRRLDVRAVIAAHDLYESMVAQESLLDFNAAWVIARDLLVGTSELRFCGACELRYLVSNDSRLAPTCPFCSLYSRRRGSTEPRLVFPAWLGTNPDEEEAA
jgi:flagellar transcriptional activator FlhC